MSNPWPEILSREYLQCPLPSCRCHGLVGRDTQPIDPIIGVELRVTFATHQSNVDVVHGLSGDYCTITLTCGLAPEPSPCTDALSCGHCSAIATTNAVVAGLIVLEAYKILRGGLEEDCRAVYVKQPLLSPPPPSFPPRRHPPFVPGHSSVAATPRTL